ncbi:V-set and immunoglobulin domain-containing protein 10-like [Hippocampus zosterae]|uniref:V-set and immunoglobulin domain-containing protein 10-like n=1 Tax=Hippocampus zosterae TaxID=109293 RepID=UPI00223D62D9|nr:V-set and immunoglobulin domain-containing protein 10-like [Hippocampus zosterae]XP_051921893.1 V-set and immunoglobulin domain-containing protein 10-like [Hippocampus zosterae]
MKRYEGLSGHVLMIFWGFAFPGVDGQLLVSALGATRANTLAGANLTLAVSFSGAPDPAVTWFKGRLPVVTWTLGSDAPPDVAEEYRQALRLEPNGSLSFVRVPLGYGGDYTVEMTKSGLGAVSLNFTLRVFELLENVTMTALPDLIEEGSEQLSVQYRMLRGVVERQLWFFNGRPVAAGEDGSRYLLRPGSLAVRQPRRNDTGRYTVSLSNPFSSVTLHLNVTVLYGPDEPRIQIKPVQDFYVSGDELTLSCQADGSPQPLAEWTFGGQTLSDDLMGVLNLTAVQTNQSGLYVCRLRNQMTGAQRQRAVAINVYERPAGRAQCSVVSEDNRSLRYSCRWSGGTPPAALSFPSFRVGSSLENVNVTVNASSELDGRIFTCRAHHPVENSECNVTAESPQNFFPSVRTEVDSEGKIVVSMRCLSRATPPAAVRWFRGGEPLGGDVLTGDDGASLRISHRNVSVLILQNYTCACRNPLGSRSKHLRLQEPAISNFSLFPHKDGTIVTLTWEVPPTSIVTGFDIQMSGPALASADGSIARSKGNGDTFRTILPKPGSARSADVLGLDPKATYRFRVLPRALMTEGRPTEARRIGPADGLSGPAIAGIAAGIPCSILFLLLMCGLVYLAFYCSRAKRRQTSYPVSRAVEKVTTAPMQSPHNLLPGGVKSPPEYNRLHQTPSSLSVAAPPFVPPPPVRVATTV